MNEQAPSASVEMPRYQSHKKVWALEVTGCAWVPSPENDPTMASSSPGAMLTFAEKDYAPMPVKPAVVSRYFPQPGDFLVVYEDGYQSISPRKAFLEGYTKL